MEVGGSNAGDFTIIPAVTFTLGPPVPATLTSAGGSVTINATAGTIPAGSVVCFGSDAAGTIGGTVCPGVLGTGTVIGAGGTSITSTLPAGAPVGSFAIAVGVVGNVADVGGSAATDLTITPAATFTLGPPVPATTTTAGGTSHSITATSGTIPAGSIVCLGQTAAQVTLAGACAAP